MHPLFQHYTQRAAVLYKHYDAADVPIYYGISTDHEERQTSHRSFGEWMQFSARCEVEEFDTWHLAEAAERAAIREDVPIFNRRWAPGCPRERKFNYLVKVGRADLLNAALVRDMNGRPSDDVLIQLGRQDIVEDLLAWGERG
jgi:hypothetical protein